MVNDSTTVPIIDPEFKSYLRALDDTEYAQLETDILAHGCRKALDVWRGLLLDGHHRLSICEKHGLPYDVQDIVLEDRDAALVWMCRNQLARRNVGKSEFAYLMGKLYEAKKRQDGGHGDQKSGPRNEVPKTAQRVAEEFGVSRATVERAAQYTRAVDKMADGEHRAAAEIVAETKDTPRSRFVASIEADIDPRTAIHASKSNQWYTPTEYIASAREVMGGIDVDPASNDEANEIVRATTYYTAEHDGLARKWPGRVWLNPPWGGQQAQFIANLLEQFAGGTVTEAVVLVNAHATETDWFAPLWDYPLCFTDHRINFYGGNGVGSTHGSVFVYLGDNETEFVREFDQWGYCVRRIYP